MRSCPKKEAFRSAIDNLDLSLNDSSATNRQGTDIWLDILYILDCRLTRAMRCAVISASFTEYPINLPKGSQGRHLIIGLLFKFLGRVLGPAQISIHLMRDYLNLRGMLLTTLFPSCGVSGPAFIFLITR